MEQSAAALVAAFAPVPATHPDGLKADVLGDAAGEDDQILRNEGELPTDIDGIERRAALLPQSRSFQNSF